MPGLNTRQRGAAFYIAWFTRCFYLSDSGWLIGHTPDGRGIMYQDAFFWRSLEIVSEVMNWKVIEARKRAEAISGS